MALVVKNPQVRAQTAFPCATWNQQRSNWEPFQPKWSRCQSVTWNTFMLSLFPGSFCHCKKCCYPEKKWVSQDFLFLSPFRNMASVWVILVFENHVASQCSHSISPSSVPSYFWASVSMVYSVQQLVPLVKVLLVAGSRAFSRWRHTGQDCPCHRHLWWHFCFFSFLLNERFFNF